MEWPREAPGVQWRHLQSGGNRGPAWGSAHSCAACSFVFAATAQGLPKILVYEGVYIEEQHILLSFLDYAVSILGKAGDSICRAQCKRELQGPYSKKAEKVLLILLKSLGDSPLFLLWSPSAF